MCNKCFYGNVLTDEGYCEYDSANDYCGFGLYAPISTDSLNGNFTDSYIKCMPCPYGCGNCMFNPSENKPYCFECVNDFEFFLNIWGECLKKECPESTLFNPDIGCEPCPLFCKSCFRTSDGTLGCETCYLGFTSDSNGVCAFDASTCPSDTFAHES